MRTTYNVVLGAVVALAISAATATAAGATVDDSTGGMPSVDLPIALANPTIDPAIIAELPDVVQQSTVTIDEGFVPGSPIVYPDGTPVEGQGADIESRVAAARRSCSGTAVGTGTGLWGTANVCGVAVFGSPGYVRSYSWRTSDTGIAAPSACVQARGFNSRQVQTWYGVSCGTFFNFHGVEWGNVLGNPAVRAQSLHLPWAVSVNWTS